MKLWYEENVDFAQVPVEYGGEASSHFMSLLLGREGSISIDSSLDLWHADAGCIDSSLNACRK